jgi:uncharacterized protein (DUF1697 family)
MADRAVYVALLRGINVGGNARILMADLREIATSVGFADVATYIQSGNLVFTAERAAGSGADFAAETAMAGAIRAAILGRLGLDVDVMVRRAAELVEAVAANPFPDADPKRLLFVFLSEPPSAEARQALKAIDAAPEEVALTDRTAYLHLPNGIGRAVLPTILERRLGVRGTGRNLDTVRTLVAMSDDVGTGPVGESRH